MLIADIGEIVSMYQDMTRLDSLIENVKAGRLTVSINGNGMGSDMRDAVADNVVSFLRSQRSAIVQKLNTMGFSE